MSWNKPSEAPKPVQKEKPNAMRGAIAGLAVVAILGVAAFFIFGGKDVKPKAEKVEKKPAQLAEVKPAAAPTAASNTVVKKVRLGKDWREKEIQRIEAKYGTNVPNNLKSHLYFLKHPPKLVMKPEIPYGYLNHSSERIMASVMVPEPGTFFVAQPEFGESFNLDFANALSADIDILPDDSDEVREVKQLVTQAKKELAEISQSEGKKPNEIMNEHAKALYELGHFQQNLEQTLQMVRDNPDMTDADVEDAFKAANEIRKKKGLSELRIPNLTRRMERLKKKLARELKREKKQNGKSQKEAK